MTNLKYRIHCLAIIFQVYYNLPKYWNRGLGMKRRLALCLAVMILLPVALAEQPETAPGGEEVVIVTSEGRELKFGDKGEDVSLLQTRLKDLYYYKGPVSGNYLEITRKAVRAVQEAYGLIVTGIADLKLQELVYGDAHRPLQKGSSGKDVSRLQTRLSELGYYWGKISGDYLDGTTAAVGKFQQDNGLPKTGKADVGTLIKLYSDDIVLPSPDPLASPRPLPTPPPDVAFKGVVSYGAKNDQVKLAQERLAALGFFDRKVTGGFYEHTSKAVSSRSTTAWFPTVIGEETWQVLFGLDVRAGGQPKPVLPRRPFLLYRGGRQQPAHQGLRSG